LFWVFEKRSKYFQIPLTSRFCFAKVPPHTDKNTIKIMRTKTLLLTAAVMAVGITASQAQVYSVNAVGYVNLSLPAGYSMISNPLNGTNNNLSTILPTVPDGTQILAFDDAGQHFAADVPSFVEGFGWFPDGVLPPGIGVFILLPNAFTLTFVGEVPQGNLTNGIVAGYSMKSSQVPQTGRITTDLSFPAVDGDQVFQFNNVTQHYVAEVPSFVEGFGWFPYEPTNNVGESFFVLKSGQANWTRSFSVNQ